MIHKIKYFVLFFFIISCTTDSKRIVEENIKSLEISRTEDPISFSSYIKNENTEIRLQVVNTIAKIGSNNHLNLLKEFLNDKSPKVINASIFALGQIKDNKSENLLLKLLNSTTYNKFQQQIIKSLGVSGTSVAIKDILSLLPSFSDSLKYHAIQSICFIYSRNAKSDFNPLEIQKYLTNPSEKIRTAAAYFFVRNPNSSVIKNLIRTKFTGKSIGYKYRMQALDRGLADYYIQDTDSIIFDSLKNDILHQINRKTSSWQLKLHILSLLANYPDTESVNHISKFLHHQNPHIRLKSITLLDKISLPETKNPLLRFYEKASWTEKGSIILALAGKDSLLTHRLIQQNLDQGTTYFKQLLLRSLAKIADETSIQQLRQFLIVPDKRLKFTAFDALSDLNYLTYDDVKTFLDSGDLALATLAASYLSEHPEIINLDDLILAYNNIPDTGDNDAQLAILDLLESLQNKKSREFLLNIYIGTSNRFIANKTRRLLEKFNVKIPTKTTDISKSSLPFEIMNSQDPVNISIKTEKGIIEIELWPDISPITVSNFVKLTNEGFYNNITFHRVIGDFVIQGGDPRGDGWGGPGYSIPCEYNNKPFIRGSVGMATAGKDTGGSQFFICHSPQPHLNRRYTVFGHVIKGMDIVDIIEKDDKILEIITN